MNTSRPVTAFLAIIMLLFFGAGAAHASPTLKTGSHGHNVFLLQQKLKEVGYAITSVDGVFGAETERAVAEFQRDQKMRITGIVNNSTWRALQNVKQNATKPAEAAPLVSESSLGKMLLDGGAAEKLVATAKKYIGTPYAFGGTTPSAFDCSGYLQYVFRENGINIPRMADEQYSLGVNAKTKNELVAGDLVFFSTDNDGISHVGIYLGGGEFIHASSSKGVRIDELSNSYWQPRFYGGKKIVK